MRILFDAPRAHRCYTRKLSNLRSPMTAIPLALAAARRTPTAPLATLEVVQRPAFRCGPSNVESSLPALPAIAPVRQSSLACGAIPPPRRLHHSLHCTVGPTLPALVGESGESLIHAPHKPCARGARETGTRRSACVPLCRRPQSLHVVVTEEIEFARPHFSGLSSSSSGRCRVVRARHLHKRSHSKRPRPSPPSRRQLLR